MSIAKSAPVPTAVKRSVLRRAAPAAALLGAVFGLAACVGPYGYHEGYRHDRRYDDGARHQRGDERNRGYDRRGDDNDQHYRDRRRDRRD